MTKHYRVKKMCTDALEIASKTLQKGGTVVFPTETVYGLGANALDENAVKKIFIAKGRPADNPLIIHVSSIEQLNTLTQDISSVARLFIDAFWPGPLTLVFKKKNCVPSIVTGGLETVAVRMPSDDVAREIIAHAEVPVAAPSANISGRPSPTREAHVLEDMMGKVDVIITNGDVEHGVESTVVDVSCRPSTLLRPGAITLEQLREIEPALEVDATLLAQSDTRVPKSPGMKYKHYAPNAQVYVVSIEKSEYEVDKIIAEFKAKGQRVYYIDTDSEQLSKNLFAHFREADNKGYNIVLVKAVPTTGLGLAVMNRLLKAAEFKVL